MVVCNALLSGAVLAENFWGRLVPSASRGAAGPEGRGSIEVPQAPSGVRSGEGDQPPPQNFFEFMPRNG